MSDSVLDEEKAEEEEGVSSSSLKKSRPMLVPPKNLQPPRQPQRFLLRLLRMPASSGQRNHSLGGDEKIVKTEAN